MHLNKLKCIVDSAPQTVILTEMQKYAINWRMVRNKHLHINDIESQEIFLFKLFLEIFKDMKNASISLYFEWKKEKTEGKVDYFDEREDLVKFK